MLRFYMLVGVPGSGKSTWVWNRTYDRENFGPPPFVISMDQYIDWYADENNKTYSEVFKEAAPWAEAQMKQSLNEALDRKIDNIVWDQTNLSVKSRAKKLAKIPKDYRKIAVFFETPNNIMDRLASRPGKEIPLKVFYQMADSLTIPTLEEGFDEIRRVNTDG